MGEIVIRRGEAFQYFEGQIVRCVNTSKENIEGLVVGELYTILGYSQHDGNIVYAVRDVHGKIHHSMDRFVEMTMPPFSEEDFSEEPHEDSIESIIPVKVVDNVNHPAHYTSGKYEAIDVIEDAVEGLPAIEAFLTAQVLKYILRWFHKNGLEDLKKARWYLDRLISKLEKKG